MQYNININVAYILNNVQSVDSSYGTRCDLMLLNVGSKWKIFF